MTYYKATRPDGTDFRTGKLKYTVGEVIQHPTSTLMVDDDAATYLSVSTSASDCTGMSWPCKLLTVEPVEGFDVITPEPHNLPNKRAALAWRVTGELDPVTIWGINGPHVAALIERARTLSAEELSRLAAALDAALDAARDAALDAARAAAWDAAWDATRDATRAATRAAAWDATRAATRAAAWDAARAAALRDLIGELGFTQEHYDLLTGPWRRAIGPIHPDDEDLFDAGAA